MLYTQQVKAIEASWPEFLATTYDYNEISINIRDLTNRIKQRKSVSIYNVTR